jgi:prolipoprotein diacylglyceryltransferase
MYPRFSDLINDLFGTSINLPVQTYGFFIATAFVVAGFLLYLELKRKEKAGIIAAQQKTRWEGKPAGVKELVAAGVLLFMAGFKIGGIILDYAEFSVRPQKYIMSGEGSWLLGILACAAGVGMLYYKKKRAEKPKPVQVTETVHPYMLTGNIILIAAFFGIVGSKVFDIIEHLDQLFMDPFGTIFSFSGLTFYGGLITAAFAVAIYAERNKIPWPVIGDSVAPSLILAYGIGRIGCQLSGDGCWGIVNLEPKPEWLGFLPDWAWAFNYPHNVINEGILMSSCGGSHCHMLEQPVFPTPFYETCMALLIFTILWSIRKRIAIPGALFSIYLMLNGVERFIIEKIRINIRYNFLGVEVTQAELIAVGLFLTGVIFLVYFYKRYKKKAPL